MVHETWNFDKSIKPLSRYLETTQGKFPQSDMTRGSHGNCNISTSLCLGTELQLPIYRFPVSTTTFKTSLSSSSFTLPAIAKAFGISSNPLNLCVTSFERSG